MLRTATTSGTAAMMIAVSDDERKRSPVGIRRNGSAM
jgi:hypothetical protein